MVFVVFFLIVFIVLLFMNTRVRIRVNNEYLIIYIYKLRILKIRLEDTKRLTVDNINKFNKIDLKYIEILKSIDFRLIRIELCGMHENYARWATIYGILYSVLSLPDRYFKEKGTKYIYNVNFYGVPSFLIESIFYFKLGKILLNTWKLRRNIHGKRTSD